MTTNFVGVGPGSSLATYVGTDKVDLGYLPTYQDLSRLLYAATDHDARILEVGVAVGGGMDLLADVFHTDQVYGVDLNLSAGRDDQADRIVNCSQDDPALPLVLASNGWAPFDLIVDDASHEAGPTSVTLANLWDLVRPGGYYVIEDWNFFDGPGNASNLWQKVIGGFLAWPVVGDPRALHPYSGVLPNVDSVTVRNGQIIVHKGIPADAGKTDTSP